MKGRGHRIVVFASGGGSNFEALASACKEGRIVADIALLVVSSMEAGAIQRAKKFDIPVSIDTDFEAIKQANPTLICLAGYMKLVPKSVLALAPTMNIHPALLPSFGGKGMYGKHVHKAVIDSGVKQSGATVHFVDDKYDTGPIIMQQSVPIAEGETPDTLAKKVLEVEHVIYPRAVELFCNGEIFLENGQVRFG